MIFFILMTVFSHRSVEIGAKVQWEKVTVPVARSEIKYDFIIIQNGLALNQSTEKCTLKC
jgi:hypothetical protein